MHLTHPRLSLSILALGASLAAFHWFATLNFLYWQYVWLDTVSHFLGGTLVGLIALRLLRGVRLPFSGIIPIIVLVSVVGVGWETFEVLIGSPREANYAFDTSLDLLMDILGACFAYLLFGDKTKNDI
jgi:hypothetical protein